MRAFAHAGHRACARQPPGAVAAEPRTPSRSVMPRALWPRRHAEWVYSASGLENVARLQRLHAQPEKKSILRVMGLAEGTRHSSGASRRVRVSHRECQYKRADAQEDAMRAWSLG
eukprot:6197463-Pleurochrysis_carterae.AAC.1